LKYQPAGFNGHFGIALFDLKRQNVPTTVPGITPTLQNQTGEITSRGLELEAVANVAPGLKMVGAFTTYDLFTSKDANPALIGLTPTNTPQQKGSLWADYTFQKGPLTGFGFGGGVRYVGKSLPIPRIRTWFLRSYSAMRRSITNGKTGVRPLNVINVADKVYVASCASDTSWFYGDRRRGDGKPCLQVVSADAIVRRQH